MKPEPMEFDMTTWTFSAPGKESKVITAIFPMTEPQARASAKRMGYDVVSFSAYRKVSVVKVYAEPIPTDEKLHLWRVIVTRAQSQEVEVEAETEEKARELAKDEARPGDWESDSQDIEDIEDLGPVKDEE